jgi:hypothetical protein
MKYRYFTEKLSNGDKIKLRVSDVIRSGNSYGEMREVICVKCGGQKTSQYPEKTKECMCTLCKGSGKYEVFCHVGNDFWSGD